MSESRGSFGQAIAEYIGGDQTTLAIRIFWIVLLFDPIGHQVTEPLLYILAFFGLTNRRLVWRLTRPPWRLMK